MLNGSLVLLISVITRAEASSGGGRAPDRCKFRPATAEFIYSISSGKSVGVGAVSAVAPPVTVPLNFFEDTHGVVQTTDPLFLRGGGGFSLIYEGLLVRCSPHPPSNLTLAGPVPVG